MSTTFQYVARTERGKKVRGTLEVGSKAAAVTRLTELDLRPITVQEAGEATGLHRDVSFGGRGKSVKLKDLAIVNRQLATMLAAGLTLVKALTLIADQTPNPSLAGLLRQTRDNVENGSTLSAALERHDTVFPLMMTTMVAAGETGGFLNQALETVAVTMEKQVALRAHIKSAMTYPIVVLSMAAIAVVVMLTFIVPIFKDMFDGFGSELPLPTRMLVSMSGAMTWLLPVLIVLVGVSLTWWQRNKQTLRVRRAVDPIALKLPLFGGLNRRVAVARFTRGLASMLGAGVPVLHALRTVAQTCGNTIVGDAIMRCASAVDAGDTLSVAVSREPAIQPLVAQMTSIGEESGSIEDMLNNVSKFLEDEVATITASLTALLEPLLVAVLGILIGGMVLALYLPVFSIIGVMSS